MLVTVVRVRDVRVRVLQRIVRMHVTVWLGDTRVMRMLVVLVVEVQVVVLDRLVHVPVRVLLAQ